MAPQTTVQIPTDLKPADGRFGCGPSKVRPEALARPCFAGLDHVSAWGDFFTDGSRASGMKPFHS